MKVQTEPLSGGRMTLNGFFQDRGLDLKFVENLTRRLFPDDCGEGTDPEDWPEVQLTGLQRKVLGDPSFWAEDSLQNLILQGATSAGKTLLGETAAYVHLHHFYRSHRARSKVIFLVPLKVLVTARYKALSADFKHVNVGNEKELRIYASSSDYQEYDGDILNGSFDIAVIVYEKFFAMLAQQPDFKEHCGLVIVDELQMLSSNDRGPKLEFSIQQLRGTQTRLIGLVTSDCTVNAVSTWLNAKVIGCDSRPVGLFANAIDYITGEQRSTYLHGENEPESFTEPQCRLLPVADESGYGGARAREEQKKQSYLLSLLHLTKDELNENRQKILIFVNSKLKAVRLAQAISKSELLSQSPSPGVQTLTAALEPHRDEEEDVSELLDGLIKFGIAVHHASFPSVVREAIEDDFRSSSGCLRIIVCTETLMMGVNLPTDMVILYDCKVFRASARATVPITKQEYHNYIGRAGRLGMTGKEYGSSYLFTDSMRNFLAYHTQEKDEVTSAFEPKMEEIKADGEHPEKTKANGENPEETKTNGENPEETKANGENPEKIKADGKKPKAVPSHTIQKLALELAPYYLNLVTSNANGFQKSDLCEHMKNSMYIYTQEHSAHADWSTRIDQLSQQILDFWLEPCRFTIQIPNPFLATQYQLTQDGRSFAPYAIALSSSCDIQDFLKNNGKQIKREHLQVQERHASQSDRLLDLFYVLCKTADICDNPALPDFGDDPSKRDQQRSLDQAVRKYLQSAKKSDDLFFEKSPLRELTENEDINSSKDLKAAMRAILLRLWTQGTGIRAIRKITDFNIRMSSGDFARISEACAYLLEAMSMVMRGKFGTDRVDVSYYQLSTCVKYGVPRQLVSLANLHTYGVSRNMLLEIKRKADSQNEKAEDYVLYNTWKDLRYRHLQEQLKKRREVDNYERQLNFIRDSLPAALADSLNELYRLDNRNENWQQVLQDMLKALPCSDQDKVWADAVDNGLLLHLTKDASKSIHLVLVENPEKWEAEELPDYTTVLVLAAASKTTSSWSEALRAESRLIITMQMLGMMIACVIAEAEDNAPAILQLMLSDLCGQMIQGLEANIYFNSINRIRPLVKAYTRKEQKAPDEKNSILIHSFVESPNCLKENGNLKAPVLPWHKAFQSSMNVITLYHPAMENSRNAKALLDNSKVVLLLSDQVDRPDCGVPADRVIEISDTSENVLRMIDRLLRDDADDYEYKLGISYRKKYEEQISELYQCLTKHIPAEQIWKMKEKKSKEGLNGEPLEFQLQDIFKRCQYFIIGDTEDYLDSFYTKFAEYGAIRSRLKKLTAQGKESPVFLVRIDGAEGCQRLEELLGSYRHSIGKKTEETAQLIWEEIRENDRREG